MKRFPFFAALLFTMACDGAADPSDPPATVATGEEVAFGEVHAIFSDKCGPCHVSSGSGGHNIGGSDVDAAYTDSQTSAAAGTLGDFSLERIQNGSMPQGAGCTGVPATDDGNAACLTGAEQDLIEQWILDGQKR